MVRACSLFAGPERVIALLLSSLFGLEKKSKTEDILALQFDIRSGPRTIPASAIDCWFNLDGWQEAIRESTKLFSVFER